MSLDWSVTKIKNHDEVTSVIENGVKKWHPTTEALVWMCMSIDMQGITETNVKEFYIRCKIFEAAFGPYRCKTEADPKDPTKDVRVEVFWSKPEIESHIGLSTNVCTKTRKQFLRNVTERLEREAVRSYNYEMEQEFSKQQKAAS